MVLLVLAMLGWVVLSALVAGLWCAVLAGARQSPTPVAVDAPRSHAALPAPRRARDQLTRV